MQCKLCIIFFTVPVISAHIYSNHTSADTKKNKKWGLEKIVYYVKATWANPAYSKVTNVCFSRLDVYTHPVSICENGLKSNTFSDHANIMNVSSLKLS